MTLDFVCLGLVVALRLVNVFISTPASFKSLTPPDGGNCFSDKYRPITEHRLYSQM